MVVVVLARSSHGSDPARQVILKAVRTAWAVAVTATATHFSLVERFGGFTIDVVGRRAAKFGTKRATVQDVLEAGVLATAPGAASTAIPSIDIGFATRAGGILCCHGIGSYSLVRVTSQRSAVRALAPTSELWCRALTLATDARQAIQARRTVAALADAGITSIGRASTLRAAVAAEVLVAEDVLAAAQAAASLLRRTSFMVGAVAAVPRIADSAALFLVRITNTRQARITARTASVAALVRDAALPSTTAGARLVAISWARLISWSVFSSALALDSARPLPLVDRLAMFRIGLDSRAAAVVIRPAIDFSAPLTFASTFGFAGGNSAINGGEQASADERADQRAGDTAARFRAGEQSGEAIKGVVVHPKTFQIERTAPDPAKMPGALCNV